MAEKLLTAQDVADRFQLSAALVRKHSGRDGRAPQILGFKVGKLWRYSQAQIDAWILSLEAIGGMK